MFKRVSSADTRKLASAVYALTESRRRRLVQALLLALVAIVCGGALGIWWQRGHNDSGKELLEETLKRDNERLTQAVQQMELQVRHETSTRESLERQLSEQSEEIKRLRSELEFFQKNRKVAPGGH